MTLMRTTIAFALLIAFAGCGGESSPTDPDGPVAFTTVWHEQASGMRNAGAQVVARQEPWAQLWEQIVLGRAPKPPLPAIDFEKNILIVATLGETGDSCTQVRIDQVSRRSGILDVTISEIRRPPSCSCPPVVVNPVHVVAVPRAATGATYNWRTLVEGQPCN